MSVSSKVLIWTVAFCALGTGAWAEDVQLGGKPDESQRSCVEVEINGQRAPGMNCLNQELAQKAAAVARTPSIAPLDALSPAVRVGGFSQAAVAQQYGQNFGKSAQPYRPPAPVYASPLGGR
ncbi:MAG TPA: hypothetical protein VGM26_17470 [Rhizomicrobium sp.]|jgi:hypothetical protein